MTMPNAAVFQVLGTIGGVSYALSLVPQVIYTYKTKRVSDISYAYQCFYIIGCTLTNTYAIGLGLWPIYASCLIEQSLIMSLTLMKYIYEKEDVCHKEDEDEVAVDVEVAIKSSLNINISPQRDGHTKKDRDKRRQLLNSMGRSGGRLGMSTSWLREVIDDDEESSKDEEKKDESAGEDVETARNNDTNESIGNLSRGNGRKNDGDKRRQLMNRMGKSSRLGVSTLWLNAIKDSREEDGAEAVKRSQLMSMRPWLNEAVLHSSGEDVDDNDENKDVFVEDVYSGNNEGGVNISKSTGHKNEFTTMSDQLSSQKFANYSTMS